jgi:GntR family transcriptional repressor for pyruvate dehydrogenase complex
MQPTALFTPIEDRRVFKAILLQLEYAISEGRLAAGDRLPSERELAQQFGVARTSVREAMRVLEALGVVRVRAGAEHGVILISGSASALGDLLQFQLALRHISVASFVEFRVMIERWAAAAAAIEASEEGLDGLAEMVKQMKGDLDPAAFQVLDAGFHLAIAQVSRNDLLVLILEGLRHVVGRIMLDATSSLDEWPSVRARLVVEHEQILAAIRAGESTRAAQLMEKHIEVFYGDLAPSNGLGLRHRLTD